MRLECRFIDAFPQLPRPEGVRLNLLLGLFFHAFPRPLPISPSPFRFCCRLSGFSASLTMLSRKYVNVHACPIIRSSRSLFSFVSSFAISRSTFLPCSPACLSAPCRSEIDRFLCESHEFKSCRDSSSPVPRKRENDR